MTFQEAREISKTGLHVRREAWTDQWFIVWRGVWWCSDAGVLRPVLATDYTEADLRAVDWTTMPAPLAACPIDPEGTGSTGGSSATPGTGGFPAIHPPGFPGGQPSFPSGSPGTPPLPGGPPPFLPPPTDTSTVRVSIAGIVQTDESEYYRGVILNGTKTLRFSGSGWSKQFTSGVYGGADTEAVWLISAGKEGSGPDALWTVSLQAVGPSSGGFTNPLGQARGVPIVNGWESGYIFFGGGTATVL